MAGAIGMEICAGRKQGQKVGGGGGGRMKLPFPAAKGYLCLDLSVLPI